MGEASLVGGLIVLGAVLVVGYILFGKKGGIKNPPKGDPVPGEFPDPDPKEDKN